MVLRCPECSHGLGYAELLKFWRLQSIGCPGCGAPLSMDKRGRAALVLSPLASIPVGAYLMAQTGSEFLLAVAVIAGIIVGCILCADVGRVFVPDDSRENEND
jgi:uncharacterized protein (DUF983 family)